MECEWREDNDGIYQTDCGMEFVFIDSGPKENRMLFCCYCGRSLWSIKASDMREADDDTCGSAETPLAVITDASGRYLAPAEPTTPDRPAGIWDHNTDAREPVR